MNSNHSTGISISNRIINCNHRSCPSNSKVFGFSIIHIILVISIINCINSVVFSTKLVNSNINLTINNTISTKNSIIQLNSNTTFHTIININNNVYRFIINSIININSNCSIQFRCSEVSTIRAWQELVITKVCYSHVVKSFFNNFNSNTILTSSQVNSIVSTVNIHNNITNSIIRNSHSNN